MSSLNFLIQASGPQSTGSLLSTELTSSTGLLEPQTSIVLASFGIYDTLDSNPSISLFRAFSGHTDAFGTTGFLASLKGLSLFNKSISSISATRAPAAELPPCPGVVKRNAIIDHFCTRDWSAELHASLKLEETRYLQTMELAKSCDEDDTLPYWEMSEKTSLLLDWLSTRSEEVQNEFFDGYDQGFIEEIRESQEYSRGISDVMPVELLGNRWKEGVAPQGGSIEDRFLPLPPVSNAPRRLIPLHSTVVPGTEEVCEILASTQAHGVEKSKGGLSTLANIIIEGHIGPSRVFGMSQVCTGPMTRNLDPSMSAGRHGPFYILVTPDYCEEMPDTNLGLSCSYHRAYLVPTSGDARALEVALDQAAEMGMITEDHATECKQKILTYENILSPGSSPHPIAAAVLEDARAL